jgi:hypothetical protein
MTEKETFDTLAEFEVKQADTSKEKDQPTEEGVKEGPGELPPDEETKEAPEVFDSTQEVVDDFVPSNNDDQESEGFGAFDLESISGTEEEEVETFSIDENHMIFAKKEYAPFIRVCNEHAKLGNDVYSKSFYIERVDNSHIDLIYNNGLTYIKHRINTIITDKQILDTYVVDLNTMAKLLTFGANQIPILEVDKQLSAFIYGGRIPIETHNVTKKSYVDYKIQSKELSKVSVNGENLVHMLNSAAILAASGSRAEERAIYLDEGAAYVYSGSVVGKFEGKFTDICLQMTDINSVILFFADVKDNVDITIYESEVKFSFMDRTLVLPKKKLVLEDTIKESVVEITNGVSVDSKAVYDILNVLDHMPQNSGIINILHKDFGFTISSPQRAGSYKSNFDIQASIIGKGITGSLRLSLKALKTYVRAFPGTVSIGVKSNRLFIKSEKGSLVVTGNAI